MQEVGRQAGVFRLVSQRVLAHTHVHKHTDDSRLIVTNEISCVSAPTPERDILLGSNGTNHHYFIESDH